MHITDTLGNEQTTILFNTVVVLLDSKRFTQRYSTENSFICLIYHVSGTASLTLFVGCYRVSIDFSICWIAVCYLGRGIAWSRCVGWGTCVSEMHCMSLVAY